MFGGAESAQEKKLLDKAHREARWLAVEVSILLKDRPAKEQLALADELVTLTPESLEAWLYRARMAAAAGDPKTARKPRERPR